MAEELDFGAWFRTADLSSEAPPTSGWLIPAKVSLGSLGDEPAVICEFDHPRHTGRGALHNRWVRESDRANQRALEMFLALEDASDARIREFVKERGPIGVEPNGKVIADNVGLRSPFSEPLCWYRSYAKLAAAALRASAAIVRSQEIPNDDAAAFYKFWVRTFVNNESRPSQPGPGEDDFIRIIVAESRQTDEYREFVRMVAARKHGGRELRPPDATPEAARVMAVVNWWLAVKAVRPRLDWFGADRRIRWTGGLWGAIGMQLMLRVERELGRVVCARCRTPLRRKPNDRKRRPGARCDGPECVRAYEREQKRAYRAARAAAAATSKN